MSELNVLIEQMASDISSHSLRLDGLRLHLFLNWLIAHSSKVKSAIRMDASSFREADAEEQFRSVLKTWLVSLPAQGMLWEYYLILDEITWWRDFIPRQIFLVLKSEVGE